LKPRISVYLVAFLPALLFIVSAPGAAQTVLEEPTFSVEELIALALQNNPQPAVARASLEAARNRASSLKSLPNPVLQVVAGFSGSDEARDEEIILSQPLDLFGQRKAQRRVLEAQARAAQAGSTLVTRALIVEVKNAAAQLFAAQEAESLGASQTEITQKFVAAARRRAELGDVPPVQAQRAELELLRVENELTNARAERLVRRAVLNQLVGRAPETPLRVALTEGEISKVGDGITTKNLPPSPSDIPPSIFSQRGSMLAGLINRPDILSAQATLEAQRAQVEAIGKQRLPQVELQARRSAVFGSGDIALRAVITAPIFDFGSIKNEKRAAQSEVKAQEATIALLKTQVAAQVEQALVRIEQQRATVSRFQNGIVPQTLDLLRKTQIGFDAEASTYLEVLEAQRTLRAVQAEYLQALVGVRTSEAQLESALGAEPQSFLGAISNPQAGSTPEGVAAPGTVPENLVPPLEVTPKATTEGGAN
jgi:cobalt-zinc-cadmium efflux system outer membrane protein